MAEKNGKTKVRILAAIVYFDGEARHEGDVVEVDAADARSLVDEGLAEKT
jgi:hypothetical protein